MRMREAVAHLRAGLDRRIVGQLACAQRLAVRAARDELVRDVDVPRVAAEPVRAQAGGMPQLRGRLRLALGPHGRLALPRDDLQRDIESCPLVAGEPDRARAAAAERPQGPVAVEDELDAGERWGGLSHARAEIGDPVGLSFPTAYGALGLARSVSTYDDDETDLEFFEEPETLEAPGRPRRRIRPQRGGGPRRPAPPPAGAVALARLAGLVALAIAVVVGLVFWVGSCQGQSRHDEYKSYMDNVQPIAQSSAATGTDARSRTRSTPPKLTLAGLQTKLALWSARQQQDYNEALRLVPPATASGGAPAGAGDAPAARDRARRSRQHACHGGIEACRHGRRPPRQAGQSPERERPRLGGSVQAAGDADLEEAGRAGRDRATVADRLEPRGDRANAFRELYRPCNPRTPAAR